MSLYKRKDSSVWWIKITVNGRTVQKSTGTPDKSKAQEFHDRLKTQLWEQTKLGAKRDYSWNEAVVRWLNETQHKASRVDDLGHLRWLDHYLNGMALDAINRDALDKLIQAKLATEVSNSTVNRMLALVRSILRKAALEWDWLDKVPKIRLLPEASRRIRWITREEVDRLLLELPDHLKAMVRFSLETGLRQANVTGLQWSQIDLTRRCAWITSRSGQGKTSHCGAIIQSRGGADPGTTGQAYGSCLHLSGQARDSSEYQGLATSLTAGRD